MEVNNSIIHISRKVHKTCLWMAGNRKKRKELLLRTLRELPLRSLREQYSVSFSFNCK